MCDDDGMTIFPDFDPMSASDLRDVTVALITASIADDMEAMTSVLESIDGPDRAHAVIVTLVGYIHQNMEHIADRTGHDLLEIWRDATLASGAPPAA